jgi:hypothetical protein
MGKWRGREWISRRGVWGGGGWVNRWQASLPETCPRAGRSIVRKAAETFWKPEPDLQPAKILAFDPGEPRCTFAVSVAFDYPHFAKSEVTVAPKLIIRATCWAAEGLNYCMNAKSLLQIIPALMISVAMATTTIAAGKISPEQASKAMLTALNNQVSLSADQQDKAKPIIDKHVADLEAVKDDTTLDKDAKKAKVVELRKQYVDDINGILTPDQQKKWEASREANKAKVKAHVKKKAAEKAPQ